MAYFLLDHREEITLDLARRGSDQKAKNKAQFDSCCVSATPGARLHLRQCVKRAA
jgi:hypothetical protein